MMSSFRLAASRGRTSLLTKAAYSTTSVAASKNVVIVAGTRLPFATTTTTYFDELAVDLQRLAISGLLTQTALPKEAVDYVICGNVIQEVRTSNIAREAAINAGLPVTTGAHTIAQACISANAAICAGAEKIMTGHADVVIAGGCETFSDVPIRLSRVLRQKALTAQKAMKKGGTLGAIQHVLKGLKMKDISLETPAIANYTTGEVMGVSSDRLSAKFGVSREEQDEFTVRSHTLAGKAHASGWYNDEITAYKGSTEENGIKADSTVEKVSKLKPAFVKPHGTHTAANSSFLTDGAAASLLMSEEKALEMGFKPLAYLRDWSFKACDPFEELLLGPTYCSQEVLSRMGLNMEADIGVFEIHEAFAGQILSNLTAMDSQKFADDKFGGKKVGKVDFDKMNTKGGSLSIGHPFGATGSRLVTTASRRLQEENQRFALVAACADGGMGHACVLERYDN
ncbi:Trifunctional enzyme subunit beta, mitochondrial [Seminavis robusta]|uniref:acetyl-CoA C-acyltransferase n=2 Tax=Seminavis robusta TaxID=568900 RepID=A0A9N8HJQ5_9STRA|nr:Trifunctional enzyme subunit beta, mitochondrial [Seminavis robusta]|eukprot:Sro565_g167690.1 Trifunctional enzyme subunit beta, mitochondrial (455) ;mRNA; f:52766-54130